MTLELQSYMYLVTGISAFGKEIIICELADWIIRLSTYERVNFINVNLK